MKLQWNMSTASSLFFSQFRYIENMQNGGPSILSPKYHDIHPTCSYYLVPKNGTYQQCILVLVSYVLTSKNVLIVVVFVVSGLLWVCLLFIFYVLLPLLKLPTIAGQLHDASEGYERNYLSVKRP